MQDDSTAVRIPLTNGGYALVDPRDVEKVSVQNWSAVAQGTSRRVYAMGTKRTAPGRGRNMHCFIMDAPPGVLVDHENGNGLDNRRSNLRFADNSGNATNSKTYKNNTSGFRGVSWDKERRKWKAVITHRMTVYRLGFFDTAEEAAQAYDDRARELHEEFATLNFP